MSNLSWMFAPKSIWDKRPSLAHLVRMVPPTEMALILAMTNGFPEKVKRKMVDMMIHRYLACVRNAMKSKVFSKIKELKMMSLSIFMTCDADHNSPLLDKLKFRWLAHNHVEPIQLEHANLPFCSLHFCRKYILGLFREKIYEYLIKRNKDTFFLDKYEGIFGPLMFSLYSLYSPKFVVEEPIIDDEKPIYDEKELLRLVKPKIVVSVKKKDRYPPQKKLPPPIKFSSKGGPYRPTSKKLKN